MKHTLILSIALIFSVHVTKAQIKNYYDPEPINLCPFCPVKYIALMPYRSLNKTEEEYQNKLKEYEYYKKENDRFDKEYPDCENRRMKCIEQYQKNLLEWRKRNPNWRNSAINREEITSNNQNNISSKIDDVVIGETYLVTSQTLNMRGGPGTDYNVINTLKNGDAVTLIQKYNNAWWKVDFEGTKGYVYSSFLKLDSYSGWEKKNYQSGVTPDCENVIPKYDYDLDNYLRINVGSGTDVVVKLMKKGSYSDDCIRIVYVRSGDTYEIKNIPQGRYYLKIAYGKDYRKKIIDSICYVKFMKNAQYEKGIEILDFSLIKKPNERIGNNIYESWDVPSFELFLDVIETYGASKTFKASDISEEEFNK